MLYVVSTAGSCMLVCMTYCGARLFCGTKHGLRTTLFLVVCYDVKTLLPGWAGGCGMVSGRAVVGVKAHCLPQIALNTTKLSLCIGIQRLWV
jgi:hypothetical protein